MTERTHNYTHRRYSSATWAYQALIALVMAIAMVLGLSSIAKADPTPGSDRIADPDTSYSFESILNYVPPAPGSTVLTDKPTTQYNGRVWVDKTVSADDITLRGTLANTTIQNDSDFLVEYSLLATSAEVKGLRSVPVDVSFVIDNSSSMVDSGAITKTVQAVNNSIAQLMQTNPQNRVSVTLYGTDVDTLLPLGHYRTVGENGTFIKIDKLTRNNSTYSTSVERLVRGEDRYVPYSNSITQNSTSGRGTNIQIGINAGMDVLLSSEQTEIGTDTPLKRAPYFVLLSDGGATYSSDSWQWWKPADNSNDGPGSHTLYYAGNAMRAMMTAAYHKPLITQHYKLDDSSYETKVFTIGMGVQNDSYAKFTIDPKNQWDLSGTAVNSIKTAWYYYKNNYSPSVYVDYGDSVTIYHPNTNDISGDDLQYNDKYFSASTVDDLDDAFAGVVEEINKVNAKVPTVISGDDPNTSGYVTYTDPVGEYMEVKDFKNLVFADTVIDPTADSPVVSTSGNVETKTYKFEGAFTSELYGEADVSNIEVFVHKDLTTKAETVEVKVPAASIPLRINHVQLDEDGTRVTSHTVSNTWPMRLFYTVGLRSDIDPATLSGVSKEYIAAHTDDNGKVDFYSNLYTADKPGDAAGKAGDTHVDFLHATTNPFYYAIEDTYVCSEQDLDYKVSSYRPLDDDTTYYVYERYYEGQDTPGQPATAQKLWWTAITGAQLKALTPSPALIEKDGYWAVKKGTLKVRRFDVFDHSKTPNTTDTASTYAGHFHDLDNHQAGGPFDIRLGNNGKLSLDKPASLVVKKAVDKFGELDAPADAVFTFNLTVAALQNTTVDAIKYTPAASGDPTQTSVTLTFDANGATSFTLKADEWIKIEGLPEGTTFTINESSLPDGFSIKGVTGATYDYDDSVYAGSATTVNGADHEVVFTNVFTTISTPQSFTGAKVLTGRTLLPTDSFTFTLTRNESDAPMPAGTTGDTAEVSMGSDGSIDFGDIVYTVDMDGTTYSYTLQEVIPSDATNPNVDSGATAYADATASQKETPGWRKNGVVYDGTKKTVTVTVKKVVGTKPNTTTPALVAQLTVTGLPFQFENTYSSTGILGAGGDVQIVANKSLTGRDLSASEFSFTVKNTAAAAASDGPVATGTNDANGAIILSDITYTNTSLEADNQAGKNDKDTNQSGQPVYTYEYTVAEDTSSLPEGVTANDVTFDVIVKVTDDGTGKLKIAVTYPNQAQGLAFTNTYTEQDASVSITGTKTLEGRNFVLADDFQYTLTGVDGAPMPEDANVYTKTVSADVNGNIDFGSITYTLADVDDTYTYKISEVIPANATNASVNGGATTYENASDAEKKLAGWTYRGITYDAAEKTVTVEVTKKVVKENGVNVVKIVATPTGLPFASTNVYNASGVAKINGLKTLTGRDQVASEFGFQVKNGTEVVASGGNAANGAIAFSDITYTLASLEADATAGKNEKGVDSATGYTTYTYVYDVVENTTALPDGVTGVITSAEVTVVVTDDNDGTLEVAITYPDAAVGHVAFTNKYTEQNKDVSIKGTKVLKNKEITNGAFSFKLTAVTAGAPMPTGASITPGGTTSEVTVAANGTIDFGKATFTPAMAGNTYTYSISEVIPDDATNENVNGGATTYENASEAEKAVAGWKKDGIVYDVNVKTIEVTVNKKASTLLDGTNVIETTVETSGLPFTFTNEYKTAAFEGTIPLTKELVGRDWSEVLDTDAKSFEFTLAPVAAGSSYPVSEIPLPSTTTISVHDQTGETAEGHDMAEFSFGPIVFTKAGTYVYEITEADASTTMPGVESDTTVATATFVVQDDGHGSLTAGVPTISHATFTNTYRSEGAQTTFAGTKDLRGREWSADDEFSFVLTAITYNTPMPDGSTGNTKTVTATAANKNIDFGPISYTIDDVNKTFKYTIAEVIPPDATNPNVNAGGTSYQYASATEKKQAGWTKDGVVYDSSHVETISVAVSSEGGTDKSGKPVERVVLTINNEAAGAALPSFTFTNSYAPGSATGKATVTKVLEGKDWDGDSFEFKIAAKTDGAPLPDPTTVTVNKEDVAGSGKAAVNFNDITFTQPGTYVYEVSEVTPSLPAGGIAYSTNKAEITFTVTDNGDGTMKVESAVTDGSATFTNSYKSKSTTATFAGSKVLTGRAFLDTDDFQFTLSRITAGAPMPGDPGAPSSQTVSMATNGAITFGEITYTIDMVGNVYKYTVTEVIPPDSTNPNVNSGNTKYKDASATNRAKAGWQYQGVTYDVTSHPISVTVGKASETGDDGVPYEQVTLTVEGNDFAFNNSYEAKPATTSVQVKKVLEGKDWDGDSFVFVITAKTTGAPLPDPTTVTVNKEDVDGTGTAAVKFNDITYTQVGTYEYEIKELVPATPAGGMTYSSNVATVTVVVSDKGQGDLNATVSVDNDTFTNTYKTTTGYYDNYGGLYVEKVMVNRSIEADQFKYTIKPHDQASADKVGLVLGDNETAWPAESLNTYTMQAHVMNRAFASMKFTQEDSGKSYTYDIWESKGGGSGYTNDGSKYVVRVHVTDDGAGTLTVDTYVKKNNEGEKRVASYTNANVAREPVVISFKNTYDSTGILGPSGKVQIEATKSMTGRPLKNKEFTYKVKNAKTAAQADPAVATGTNDASGKISFGDITYTLKDVQDDVRLGKAVKKTEGGNDVYSYEYNVIEDTSALPGGITPLNASFTIKVDVIDNGTGTFDIKVTYPDNKKPLPFTNEYGSKGVAYISGTKSLGYASENLHAIDITGLYTFTLTADAGTPMPVDNTATNDSVGNVLFGPIKFDLKDFDGVQIGPDGKRTKAFTYKITEEGGPAYVENDSDKTKVVKITATDEGDGKITTKVEPGPNSFTFTNTYKPKATSAQFEALKVLKGNKPLAAGEFSFELKDSAGKVLQTKSNDANGKVVFDAITYTKPGTYNYTVNEVIPAEPAGGMTYDSDEYKVSVTVTDDADGDGTGDGKLTASKPAYAQGNGTAIDGLPTFTNSYEAAPTSVTLQASKTLTGRDQVAGEFSFELKDSAGKVLQTKSNDADGKVAFDTIEFTQVGEYVYTITEVQGSATRVTYDTTPRVVTIKVTDPGTGTLKATTSVDHKDGLKFTNAYAHANPVKVTLEAAKSLKGRALADGEFSFELKDGAGTVLQTKKNAADGKVAFDEIEFKKPGTYEYTISEVKGTEKNMTYDESVHAVTVTVSDEGAADLVAQVTYDGGKAPVFANVFKPEPKPLTIVLKAKKQLEGRSLAQGEFSFELKDASGKVMQTKSNRTGGAVEFDGIKVAKPGTYEYTISEVKGTDPDVTYDSRVHKVKVEVTEDANGQLAAKFVEGKDVPTFVNKYTPPKKPKTPETPVTPPAPPRIPTYLPKTGDVDTVATMALLALAGLALAGAGLVARRAMTR